jgi:hypothetical protein
MCPTGSSLADIKSPTGYFAPTTGSVKSINELTLCEAGKFCD